MPQIACLAQVDSRSVSSWIAPGQTTGGGGFSDQPGAGRRPTLGLDEQHQGQPYRPDVPTDFKKVVHQLAPETGKGVRTKTMQRLLHKNRYVWQRMRQAFAKASEPHPDARRKVCRQPLQQRAAMDECDLWYVDGPGFGFTPGMP